MSPSVHLRISIISLLLINHYVCTIGGLPTASKVEQSSHKPAIDPGKGPARLIKYLAMESQKSEGKSEPLPLAQARGGSKGFKGKGSGSGFSRLPVFVAGPTLGHAMSASGTFLWIGIFLCCFLFCYPCCMAHCSDVDHMYEPPLYRGVY